MKRRRVKICAVGPLLPRRTNGANLPNDIGFRRLSPVEIPPKLQVHPETGRVPEEPGKPATQ